MSHFAPRDPAEHELGNRGEDVPDYCRHCGHPFMEHVNSRCPGNELRPRRTESFGDFHERATRRMDRGPGWLYR